MRTLALLLLLLAPAPALALGWEVLTRPGTAVLMRHALAPGVGDPSNFRLDDCATQRNLDAAGRAQARAIGAAIRAAGASPDAVLTSRWCRARETAALLEAGPVTEAEALDSFFARRDQRAPRTDALRALLIDRLGRGERLILVSHQVNISALIGRGTRSGEAVAVDLGPDGALRVLGTLAPAD